MFAVVRLVHDQISKVVPTKFLYDTHFKKSVYCYYNTDFKQERPELSKSLMAKKFEINFPAIYRGYINFFGEYIYNFILTIVKNI